MHIEGEDPVLDHPICGIQTFSELLTDKNVYAKVKEAGAKTVIL